MMCVRNEFGDITVDGLALAVDCILAVACLIAVAFVAERLERKGLRFGISTLLTIIAVLAVLMAFWRWDAQVLTVDYGDFVGLDDVTYIPLSFIEWHKVLPALCGLGCLIYSALWLALRASSWLLRYRFAPAKAEAEGSPAQ